MEVTQKNFNEVLNLIHQSIQKSDFLAIDAEFTGLRNGWRVSSFDTPQEFYFKVLKGTADFLLIQFGLCAFYWDNEKNMYCNDAYTFYIYPRLGENTFLSNSETLEFLVANGLDLNKLVLEGLGYLNNDEEKKEREKIKQNTHQKQKIPIPKEKKELIEDICTTILNFLNKKESKTLELDKYNSFIELLLFQEVNLRFKNRAFIEAIITDKKERILKVTKTSSAKEWDLLNTRRQERVWDEFEAGLGFSKVAKLIKDSEKLVIGHNMLLDVVHTLDTFYKKLPLKYDDFKTIAHNTFPRLIDTKYMSWLPPFKDAVTSSALTLLLSDLSKSPYCMPKVAAAIGRGYTGLEDENHTAGYDAYVTGMCFLAMHDRLARGRRVDADAAVLKPFLNKLYLGRTADHGSPFMNLTGNEALPSREHVLYVKFQYGWKSKLSNEFAKYGESIVEYLSQTTAVVALSHKEQAPAVKRDFAKNKTVIVVSYDEYMKKFMKDHRQ